MAKREKKHSRVMFIITLDFPLGTDATGFEPAISALTGQRVRPLHYASS